MNVVEVAESHAVIIYIYRVSALTCVIRVSVKLVYVWVDSACTLNVEIEITCNQIYIELNKSKLSNFDAKLHLPRRCSLPNSFFVYV